MAPSVAVVGGGPAGMTAALLLARAGHPVALYERAAELGGLWASQRDADGYVLGDNSCKVFQPSYRTAPALLRLLGLDPADHFVPRHDLTREWLRPFVKDCTARDLAMFAGAAAAHAGGGSGDHEVSVAEFLVTRRLSERCQAWMRATALGGIAGTLRMTMWELFHRLSSNLDSVFAATPSALHWNARPPNGPGGFVTAWVAGLRSAGVELKLGQSVGALTPRASGGVWLSTDGGRMGAAVVLLALPPPALSRLLLASDEAIGPAFGRSRAELEQLLAASRYEHLGITWFFDRPFERDLPLGGHNVRRGWHPILVQHDQYREHLRPPAVTAVVGSVSLDSGLKHFRLGTRADAHAPEQLARLIWDDERAVDPSLPAPLGHHLAGMSAATQIVSSGPLPMRATGVDVLLATNIHGQAPYFTASLESAIQAGALAAQAVNAGVERLPMQRGQPLPWRTRAPVRRIELVTELPCPADEAWQVFVDIAGWPRWSHFVLSLAGQLEPGSPWEIELRGEGQQPSTWLRPRLLRIDPSRRLVFATQLGADWLVRMEHGFVFEDAGHGRSRLRQPFDVSGRLAAPLWGKIEPALRRFEEVGSDLARFVA